MSFYKNLKPKKSRLCIGYLNKKIEIQKREGIYNTVGLTYEFSTYKKVWSSIETTSGLEHFSKINIGEQFSHIFKIRTISELTAEYWILFNNNRYKILSIETKDVGDWQLLFCRLTGSNDYEGSNS